MKLKRVLDLYSDVEKVQLLDEDEGYLICDYVHVIKNTDIYKKTLKLKDWEVIQIYSLPDDYNHNESQTNIFLKEPTIIQKRG